MTKQEILHATQANFEELRSTWNDHMRDEGLGALVFVSGEISASTGGIECEYWTLGELRTYLRRMQENDEIVFKWLKLAKTGGGFPVVIISSGREDTSNELYLSSVRKSQKA